MAYLIKEMFGPTIQGEGVHSGAACVFLRTAVCNLACSWCDTDFAEEGAEELSAEEICSRLASLDTGHSRMLVVTGGEPALQWDEPLARAVKAAGFRVHMESNGTRELKAPVDWLTISPKPQFHDGRFHLAQATSMAADECKVVVDETVDGRTLEEYESRFACEHFVLQPCMTEAYEQSVARCLELVRDRPKWRLGLQLHKLVGVP